MIVPGQATLTGFRDRSFDVEIVIEVNDAAKDLTGLAIVADIKRSLSSAAPIETFTVGRTSEAIGVITLTLTAVQMLALEAGKYRYDIKITDDQYLEGAFIVRDTVSR